MSLPGTPAGDRDLHGWVAAVGSGGRGRGVAVGAATTTSAAGGSHRRWAGRAARRTLP